MHALGVIFYRQINEVLVTALKISCFSVKQEQIIRVKLCLYWHIVRFPAEWNETAWIERIPSHRHYDICTLCLVISLLLLFESVSIGVFPCKYRGMVGFDFSFLLSLWKRPKPIEILMPLTSICVQRLNSTYLTEPNTWKAHSHIVQLLD